MEHLVPTVPTDATVLTMYLATRQQDNVLLIVSQDIGENLVNLVSDFTCMLTFTVYLHSFFFFFFLASLDLT